MKLCNRNFKPQIILLFAIVLVFVVFGCNKSDSSINPESKTINFSTLSGKITNWNHGKDKRIVFGTDETGTFYSFGSAPIVSEGNFHLTVSNPPENILTAFDFSSSEWCNNNLAISDLAARGIGCVLCVFQDTNLIGNVRYGYSFQNTFSPGYFEENYTYMNKYLRISGYESCNYTLNTTIVNYDINLVQGWNKVLFSYQSEANDTSNFILSTGTPPTGGKWTFNLSSNLEGPFVMKKLKCEKFRFLKKNYLQRLIDITFERDQMDNKAQTAKIGFIGFTEAFSI